MVAGHLPWDERPPKKTRKKGKVTVDGPRLRNTRCTMCEKLFDQCAMQGNICAIVADDFGTYLLARQPESEQEAVREGRRVDAEIQAYFNELMQRKDR